ncbi:hypothetical protein ACCD06_28025 [Azospirillum sp. CT11-132]|uniref:hypothetical protein n=1 Tax=Azospirillum sp. CT11-132 TaxID=3396317 RepID=UPI0039A42C27
MTCVPDPSCLSLVVGGRSVSENLDRALASGRITLRPDGRYTLPEIQMQANGVGLSDPYIFRWHGAPYPCKFFADFLFNHAYAGAAVPWGCRNCYKIKVETPTLRQMWRMKALAESLSITTKSGAEALNPLNQSLYGTYLYHCAGGLEAARATLATLRPLIAATPELAGVAKISIKRCCTHIELACGPSDRYRFDPGLEAVEAYLYTRFVLDYRPPAPEAMLNKIKTLHMARVAFQIGDETYRDFTDGKPLHRRCVDYAEETPLAADEA